MTILLTITGVLCGGIVGFQLGVRGTRSYYQSILDDVLKDIHQSEEDFLGYAKATETDVAGAVKRIKGQHEK